MGDNGHAGKGELIRATLARYESPLTRYARRITGDAERARDVVQETFLRLCRDEQAPPPDRVAEWLFTVCRNKALDVRRKESRMTTLADIHLCDSASELRPHLATQQRDEADRIRKFVEELPDKQRTAVRLKFAEGLSYREIGRRTGWSVSNVGFLIHQGVKTLRRRMKHTE